LASIAGRWLAHAREVADLGPLLSLARRLGLAVRRLGEAGRGSDSFQALTLALGFDSQTIPSDFADLGGLADRAVADAEALDASSSATDIATVLTDVVAVYEACAGLSEPPSDLSPADASSYLAEVPPNLFEFVLISALRLDNARLAAFLELLDVLRTDYVEASGTRPGHSTQFLRTQQISQIVGDPSGLPTWIYAWGTPDFDFPRLLDNVASFAQVFNLPIRIQRIEDDLAAAYQQAVSAPSPGDWKLLIPFALVPVAGDLVQVGVQVIELPSPDGTKPPGLVVQPDIPEQAGATIQLSDHTTLSLRAGTNVAEVFGILIYPGDIRVAFPFRPGVKLPAAGFGVTLDHEPPSPKALIGTAGATRVELAGGSASLNVNAAGAQWEVRIEGVLKGLKVVVQAGDQDSFVGSLLSGLDIEVDLPLAIVWSSRTGLGFAGGSGFTVGFSPHLSIGPVAVERVEIGSGAGEGAGAPELDVSVGLDLSGSLGPLALAVQGIGVQLRLVHQDGNAGPFTARAGFKPPDGVDVALQAPGVSGGGVIECHPDLHEYDGMLELQAEGVGITAVGLLSTVDASGGSFSLAILGSATFPAVQIGFGFALNGIGLLVGVNRAINVPALQDLARAGRLDTLLFPADLAKNAPAVIESLEDAFPASDGQYVVGAAVRVTWGAGSLVTARLGVMVQLPAEIIAVLGIIDVTAPPGDMPAVELHLDVLGVLDLRRKTLSIDAGLRDSVIAGFKLSGQAALRMSWGARPDFVLAIGGFNPHYRAPAGFPALERVTLALGKDNPRLRLSSYLAVTSNTVQLGAAADLYAAAGPAAVVGSLKFDALLQIKPFGLEFDLDAAVAILLDGEPILAIALSLHIIGPSPWRISGSAHFSVLFVSFTVPFSLVAGESEHPAQPERVILDSDLLAELALPRNWSTRPPGGGGLVKLRTTPITPGGEETQTESLLHPLGGLRVRQTRVPLEARLDRYGADLLADPCIYRLADPCLDGTAVDGIAVADQFASAQFTTMDAAARLSQPSFVPMTSGVRITAPGMTLPAQAGGAGLVAETVDCSAFHTRVVDGIDDTGAIATREVVSTTVPGATLDAQTATAAVATRGAAFEGRFQVPSNGVLLADPSYTVADARLRPLDGRALPLSRIVAARASAKLGRLTPPVPQPGPIPGPGPIPRPGPIPHPGPGPIPHPGPVPHVVPQPLTALLNPVIAHDLERAATTGVPAEAQVVYRSETG
jgi:hypothetical protein